MCEEDKAMDTVETCIDDICHTEPLEEEKEPIKIHDMPKLSSPFVRQLDEEDHYVVTSEITPGFEWIFTDNVVAVEKLDGSCVSIVIEDHDIVRMFNRTNAIPFWSKGGFRFVEGIQKSIEREYLKLNDLENGQYFGELIGPKVNGNPYKLDRYLWMPFIYLKKHYEYKFWNKDIVPLCKDKTSAEKYTIVKEAFEGLWSLCKRKRSKKVDFGGTAQGVNKTIGFEGMAAEGIVFYPKDWDGDISKLCKLRRDMFKFFSGKRHHI